MKTTSGARVSGHALALFVVFCACPLSWSQDSGFVGSLDAPEAEVLQAVHMVVNEPVIYGTYSYEKENQLKGATEATSSSVFADTQEDGKQFFKIARNVLAPRHFKETADIGTVSVRYIVNATGSGTTAIRIDAVYVENNRRRVHHSDGTVEESEFHAIQERLEKLQAEKNDVAASLRRPQLGAASSLPQEPVTAGAPLASVAATSTQELERRVNELRHQVEMRVTSAGAALKSAPFRSATTLQPIPARAELLVVIVTKYWYGVETADGHRGWVHRSQLERLP